MKTNGLDSVFPFIQFSTFFPPGCWAFNQVWGGGNQNQRKASKPSTISSLNLKLCFSFGSDLQDQTCPLSPSHVDIVLEEGGWGLDCFDLA